MDSMDDSGFDSDPKTSKNGSVEFKSEVTVKNGKSTGVNALRNIRRSSELQKKLERQREAARKAAIVDQQPKKSPALLSRSSDSAEGETTLYELIVPHPSKNPGDMRLNPGEHEPLVAIMSDDSDDDFDEPIFKQFSNEEITQQLIKDGYNLDLEPDDEDLDLIPPKAMSQACVCCQLDRTRCVIQ
ncbi:protein FAM219A-like isoform X1 [Lineus longissimus]|uniref:protein FAM219A-like isoform X1 n=1 Tax=Lineus longissimus TaxID=88925 RepID=UPI002B4DB2D2